MKYQIYDTEYCFASLFDTETGAYLRTGILDELGRDTGIDPFMASFPHLIDVGIMGHCLNGQKGYCKKAGVGCYQSGDSISEPNMSLEDFDWIASQCYGRTNQLALGGRGDPDQHEDFEQILKISRDYNLVPNFTTSGIGMTADIATLCKQYCGAVAVSWYRNSFTKIAIDTLINAHVKTNIHYVLGRNSIDEAIDRIENDTFPKGINAVIFLLHKPVGLGTEDNVLSLDDERVSHFFKLVEQPHCSFKIGFDSCSIPAIISLNIKTIIQALDTCEGARFSCYIGPDMCMLPCSFDQEKKHGVNLRNTTIEEAWNSNEFNDFRRSLTDRCPTCSQRLNCMGGCPLMPQIVLCDRDNKQLTFF